MDVLKRRMFQAGGSVESSNVLGRGSGFYSAKPGIRRFERDSNGNVFYTTYDIGGNIIQEELVDMRLSETGDPEEALAKQRQNIAASTGVDAALSVLGLKGAKFGVDAFMKTPAGKATRDVLAKAADVPINLGKKGIEALLPFKLTQRFVKNPNVGKPKTDIFGRPVMQDPKPVLTKKGKPVLKDGKPVMQDPKPVLQTAKKLEDRSLFNFKNLEDGGFEIKPFTSALYGVPAFFNIRSELQDLVTQEPEMAEIMDREVEDGIQAGIDGLGVTDTTGNVIKEGDGTTGNGTAGDETTEGEGSGSGVSTAQTAANSLSNFFSSSAFNDALRNIGGSLVKEGRFGAGLAAGASSFADEQEAKKLLQQEQMSEILKASAEEDFTTPAKVADEGESINENIKHFEGANASVGIMNEVIALFEEAEGKGERVTGLRGRLSRAKDEISALIGFGHTPSTATKIKNYINVVKNKQIRNILNESGRTISDLDRRIVDEVFGNIDLFTSPDIALDKLRAAREQLKSSAREYQRNIRLSSTALALPGAGRLGKEYINEYKGLINDILKIDIDKVDLADYNPTVGARVIKISLTDKK